MKKSSISIGLVVGLGLLASACGSDSEAGKELSEIQGSSVSSVLTEQADAQTKSEDLTAKSSSSSSVSASSTVEDQSAAKEAAPSTEVADTVEIPAGFGLEVDDLTSGEKTTLAGLVDGEKPVVLVSYAPHCSTCRSEVPLLNAFAAEHADTLQVIGVGSTDTLEFANNFKTDTGAEYPLVWSESVDIWLDNGFTGFPQVKVVNADLTKESDTLTRFDEQTVLELVEKA